MPKPITTLLPASPMDGGGLRPARRWSLAIATLTLMITLGFFLLVAFAHRWLGTFVVPGLSTYVVTISIFIVLCALLTWLFDRRMNAFERVAAAPTPRRSHS